VLRERARSRRERDSKREREIERKEEKWIERKSERTREREGPREIENNSKNFGVYLRSYKHVRACVRAYVIGCVSK